VIADPAATAWTYRVCAHCARVKPCEPDGRMGIHYLRYGTQQPRRRKRCPGSRHAPREEQR